MRNTNDSVNKSIPDMVFDEIISSIISGEYKFGDKLPSEHDLANAMGVSRPSVKTALDRLRTLGFFEAKVGDGTYVKPYSIPESLRSYIKMLIKPSDIEEIKELAVILEDGAVCAAKSSFTGDVKLELQEIIKSYKSAYASDNHDYVKKYASMFYQTVFSLSGNKYLKVIYEVLSGIISEHGSGSSAEEFFCRDIDRYDKALDK